MLIVACAEVAATAERPKRLPSRLAECDGQSPPAVHCNVRFALPYDAEAALLPSTAVCPIFSEKQTTECVIAYLAVQLI